MLDGAKKHPEALLPELANLAGDEQSGIVAAGGDYPPIFVNRYGIDRARMTALFGDRLDEVLALLADYAGDNAYAIRAKDAARAWLDERRDNARRGPNSLFHPRKQSRERGVRRLGGTPG